MGRFADENKRDVLVKQPKQAVFRNQLFQRHHLQFCQVRAEQGIEKRLCRN